MTKFLHDILTGTLALLSCSEDDPARIAVGDLTPDTTARSLSLGGQQIRYATVTPGEASAITVGWQGSDPAGAAGNGAGPVDSLESGATAISAAASFSLDPPILMEERHFDTSAERYRCRVGIRPMATAGGGATSVPTPETRSDSGLRTRQ